MPDEFVSDDATKLEAKRERDRKHKRAQREREKVKAQEEIRVDVVLAKLRELGQKDIDESGVRYKSEARSYRVLGALYYGLKAEEANRLEEAEKTGDKIVSLDFSVVKPAETPILGSVKTFEEWLELRDKARKDLFWLGKELLGADLVPEVHQVVCNQFIVKNFDGAFPEGYRLSDVHKAIDRQVRFASTTENNAVLESEVETKDMMLLDPRGFYKSTINRLDCVSWMINVPDIRILIMTGVYKLAEKFVTQTKGYFRLRVGEKPSNFHLLFPEYIITGVNATSKEPLETPARVLNTVDGPTLWAEAVGSSTSGFHCDILKGDDIVDNENSNTPGTRDSTCSKYDAAKDLLDRHGFSDHIGTRYFVDDWYGRRLSQNEVTGEVAPIKYFRRQAWVLKPEYVHMEPWSAKIEEQMVTLSFPSSANFRKLRSMLLTKGVRSFQNQQLNHPVDALEDSGIKMAFDEDKLRAHIYQLSSVPRAGDVFVAWDWAPTANRTSDYSAGVAAKVYTREDGLQGLAILEIVFGKWKSSELSYQVVAFQKKWNPKRTIIESSPGAELLQREIHRVALKFGIAVDGIYWKPTVQQENAKRNRIKSLETLLADNRLWFVAGNWIDETLVQLTRYTGERKNKGRKDDIPDAMSFLCFFLSAQSISNIDPDELKNIIDQQRQDAARKAMKERIYGSSTPSPQASPFTPPVAPPSRNPRGDAVRQAIRGIFGVDKRRR